MKKKIIIFSSILVLIDQLIKFIVKSNIVLNTENYLIPKFLYLTNVKNTGGAFSILNDNPILLGVVGICALVFIYYYLKDKNISLIESIVYSLLIGGIIGNIIDRVILNYVVDYIGVMIFSYSFPVFNFADICIVISIFILIILEFRGDNNESRSN